jgi:putative transport protein
MFEWFANTLRSYPEIAIFISLALGYYFGSFTYKGLGLGAVTATLIAAVIIGQLEIKITGPLKPFFFLMFLFAIGYGVGPQFVRGIAKDGVPQAIFAAVVCVFCLIAPFAAAKMAGYDIGSAVGLYAGSQTISASMGLATDAVNRLEVSPEQAKKLLDGMPVAYAVTYIFGTVGSAVILALLGPALLGIDLEAACKRYEGEARGREADGWARHGLAPVRDACVPRPPGWAGRRQDRAGSRGAAPRPTRVHPADSAWRPDHRHDAGDRHSGGRHRVDSGPARGAGQARRCRR